jgi:hypothetical protein
MKYLIDCPIWMKDIYGRNTVKGDDAIIVGDSISPSDFARCASELFTNKESTMSQKTKSIVRAVSTGVTICGVVGLFVSGATEVDVSNAVKVGAMIAAIVSSLVTTLLSKK